MSYSTSRNGEVSAGPFPLGMNNKQRDHALPEGSARNIVNGDIDLLGKVSRRKGSTKVYNGLGTKGGYSCPAGDYFIEGNTLCKFNLDNTSTALLSGITGSTFAYDYFNGVVYFSDGIINKKIVNDVVLPWGLSNPAAPVMSEIEGTYTPGVYLAAYSWVDSDGVESGASEIGKITLAEIAGLQFNNLPGIIPGATTLRIYLTTPNGKVFYHVADTTSSSYVLAAGSYDSGNTLRLNFVSPPPAGSIIRHYKSRMYITNGKVTWYSEPYSFDHFRLGESFLQFPYETTVMEPVTSGIFFASDKETSFYSGNPEDGFNVDPKFNYGGIYGTSKKVPNSDDVIWQSQRGTIKGSANGECVNIQELNVATESGTSGATLIREQDGLRQVITSINNPTTSTLAAASFIEAEVIRRAT